MEKLCTSHRSNAIIPRSSGRSFWDALRGNFLDLRSSIFPRPLYFLDECTAMLTMPESAPWRTHSGQAQRPACIWPLLSFSIYLFIYLFPFRYFSGKKMNDTLGMLKLLTRFAVLYTWRSMQPLRSSLCNWRCRKVERSRIKLLYERFYTELWWIRAKAR